MPDLLIVDGDADQYLPVLGHSLNVVTTTRTAAAFEHMARAVPAVIVVNLETIEGSPTDLIVRARAFSLPPAILVTTAEPARVPEAILAGCDSVLLKPFPPNLMYSRVSRLLQMRRQSLRQQQVQPQKRAGRGHPAIHMAGRGPMLNAGSMREWPDARCPHCNHEGITSFEYASHRRGWYACLACRNVWVAKRRD